ncbi:MAG: hypothetical protein E6X34_07205 [Clostridium sp.]|uniref:hypothetical protein n=1 Tax=Clostridium sp. TaxID=1506 RepID=UPI002909D152|nr:hypothetical protein [Clostridium sp.]MDU4938228.1 hypothetical protein [Clostridium sp.]
MRKYNNTIKDYLNSEIQKNKTDWVYAKGANFGIQLQKLTGKYYEDNKAKFNISSVDINTNPNDTKPDVVLHYTDDSSKGIEVKSCKDGKLSGVTICNGPNLINDKDALLINYTIIDSVVSVQAVIETQIFRLITINSTGKYKGCLSATRDTGKKIKGRNYNSFISTNESEDYSLEELTKPELIRETVLMYSASKLVDDEYNFTDEEILNSLKKLRK